MALAYLDRCAGSLPFWQMATATVASLRDRADRLAGGQDGVASAACTSVAGGGALPGVEIPSWGLQVPGDRAAALRAWRPRPIIVRVHHGTTLLDLRTVSEDDDKPCPEPWPRRSDEPVTNGRPS